MTKYEQREVLLVKVMLREEGMVDYAARSISAAIRAAMTAKSHRELMDVAEELGLVNHPDFII